MSRFTEARAEIASVERLVGPTGLRPLPFHIWCRASIESGRASPSLLAAAEHARRYWDALLPTLPTLTPADPAAPVRHRPPARAGSRRRGSRTSTAG